MDFLSQVLVDVAMNRIPRLLIHAPPRHGKSILVSKWFPVWYFEQFPELRIILCAYEATFAARWGRAVRNEIVEFKDELDCRISLDSKANDDWETTEGGGMKTAGVGGPITGRGGNVMILDDPIKNWEEAASITMRDRLWDWWDTTFYPRLEPRGSIVVNMTRWHNDDIAARIIDSAEKEDWKIISLPAIAEENDILGRKPGDPLWPERYDITALNKVKKRSIYVYTSQYQQKPPDLQGSNVYNRFSVEPPPKGNVDASVELVENHPLHLAMDFNIDPGMHGIIGQWFEDRDLLTARHMLHAPKMDTRRMMIEFKLLLEQIYGEWKWTELQVFGDPTGRNKWAGTGKSCWDIVRESLDEMNIKYRLRISSYSPAIADRAMAFNSALMDGDGEVHYLVHPDCQALIDDFTRLKWDGDEINKKDRKLSHPSDAEGYRVLRLRPIRKMKTGVGAVGIAGGIRYGS